MFTDRTNYALRILLEMARRDLEGFETTSELAESTSLPAPYVRKVVSELVSLGYLQSRKGPGGGVGFRSPPRDIQMGSLLEDLGDLGHGDPAVTTCCPSREGEACFAEYFIDRFRDEVVADMTLEDLSSILGSPAPPTS